MRSMTPERPDDAARFGGVRRSVWALLIGAVVLTVCVPTLAFWRAAHAAIVASACVWPAAPTVGSPAELRVSLPDATDRAAINGPWGQIVAAWDMPTMQMQRQRQTTSGDSAKSGSYVIPLTLSMAGPWLVQVALSTPGRPEWQASLVLQVRSASPPPSPIATSGAPSTTCVSV